MLERIRWIVALGAIAVVGYTGAKAGVPKAEPLFAVTADREATTAFSTIAMAEAFGTTATLESTLVGDTVVVSTVGATTLGAYLPQTTDTTRFSVVWGSDDSEKEGTEERFDLKCTISVSGSCIILGSLDDEMEVDLPEGGPVQNYDVIFTTGSTVTTGTVGLEASHGQWQISHAATKSLNIVLPMDVSTKTIPSSVTQYASAQTATFDVENTTSAPRDYVISCSWGGGTTCTPDDDTLTINAYTTATATATFDAGSVTGDHAITLTATALGSSDTATDTITVDAYASVIAYADDPTVYAAPSAVDTSTFTVRFPGQTATNFDMSCSGASCSLVAGDTLLSVGDTEVSVRVAHTAGSEGQTRTVTLTAEKSNDATVTTTADLEVVAAGSVLLDYDGANAGMEWMKSDCPTIAAGAGAIVCDDYQYVYSFTPVTRMNRTRQLSLVHHSTEMAPQGRVYLDYVLPPDSTLPDTIRARVRVSGNDITDWNGNLRWKVNPKSTWMGQSYEAGVKHRLAFEWSWHNTPVNPELHDVDVIFVQVYNGGTNVTDTISGYTTSLDRRWTFGSGWWMAGWENVTPETHPTTGDDILIWHTVTSLDACTSRRSAVATRSTSGGLAAHKTRFGSRAGATCAMLMGAGKCTSTRGEGGIPTR